MALYPPLLHSNKALNVEAEAEELSLATQQINGLQFRLQNIYELEKYLRSEIESRGRIHKKYQRAVNALDGTCAALGTACLVTVPGGLSLLTSGVGFIPGIVIEAIAGVACLLDIIGIAVSRRCSAKAAKHEAVRILASSKLNTVHSHISKALEDSVISDDEYKLILDEVEKYRIMKEELRHKHAPAGGVIDEKTKNELIERGRKEAHASFIKKLGESESPSAVRV